MDGPIGIGDLEKEYGGRIGKGTIGEHKRSGAGANVRIAIHQLEKAGLVKAVEKKGRRATERGVALMVSLAEEIKRNLEKQIPELKKYG